MTNVGKRQRRKTMEGMMLIERAVESFSMYEVE